MSRGLADLPALWYFMDMKKNLTYIGEITKMVAAKYDPNARVAVRGPYEGTVTLPDGYMAKFDSSGVASIPRKSLGAANAIGVRKIPAPRKSRKRRWRRPEGQQHPT
jgi:hypothetical protein